MNTNKAAAAETNELQKMERKAGVPEAQPKKPDFYDHVMQEETDPAHAARMFAAMNRRKDYALRMLGKWLRAGRPLADALNHAHNIAFPKDRKARA